MSDKQVVQYYELKQKETLATCDMWSIHYASILYVSVFCVFLLF